MFRLVVLACLISHISKINCDNATCFKCDGSSEKCNDVNSNTVSAIMLHSCCVEVARLTDDDTLKASRYEPQMADGTTCTDVCKSITSENLDVLWCKSCNPKTAGNNCNSRKFKDFKCYSCENCTSVNKDTTPTTPCPADISCYTVLYKNDSTGNLKTDRRCSPFISTTDKELDDSEVRELMKTKVYEKKVDTTYFKFITCKEGAGDHCNNKSFVFPCKSCNDFNCQYTDDIIDCPSRCCYSEVIYTDTGYTYARGCAKWKGLCEDYCAATKSVTVDRVKCHSCTHVECNSEELQPLECYYCDDDKPECDVVEEKKTVTAECRCCYQAEVRDKPRTDFHKLRGCITWKPGFVCNTAAVGHIVKESFFISHPAGTLVDYSVCDPATGTLCNDQPIAPLVCYECTNCNTILSNTNTTKYTFPGFCYTIYVSRDQHDGTSATRNYSSFDNMDYACSHLEEEHMTKYPDGGFDDCAVCDSPMLCNGVDFEPSAPLLIQHPAVSCYKCNNCNFITGNTKTVSCSHEDCCYHAVFRTTPNSTYSTYRGCVWPKEGMSCYYACHIVEARFRIRYPQSQKHACVPCDGGAGDNCNYLDFILPAAESVDAVMCYDCEGCYRTNSTSPNTHCADSRCCYSAEIVTGDGRYQVVRGCAATHCSASCSYYGNASFVISCSPCGVRDVDGCNSKSYPVPVRTTPKDLIGSVGCYECYGCDKVSRARSGLTECADPRCCYRALLKDHRANEQWVTIRSCAHLQTGVSCERTCKYMEVNHLRVHRHGLVHVCTQCEEGDGHKCNNRTFHRAVAKTRPKPIKCYECRRCDKVTIGTWVIDCLEAACCYSAYLRDDPRSEYYTVRGCSSWIPGGTCEMACTHIENEHTWTYPDGEFVKCVPCLRNDTDKCNTYSYYPLPKQLKPDLVAINCYDCMDCATVTLEHDVIQCPAAGCCYTALVKKNAEDFHHQVMRSCSAPNQEGSCIGVCSDARVQHLWLYPLGKFIGCTPCEDHDADECNNKPFVVPAVVAVPEDEDYIMCYECLKNCNKVAWNTPKIRCPAAFSCYIALVTKSPKTTLYATRGCADTCQDVKAMSKEGNFHYCMMCSEDTKVGCNRHPYRSGVEQKQFKCYKCKKEKCNKVVPGTTPTVTCPHAHCCYIALMMDDQSEAVSYTKRGCAKNCADPCQEVTDKHIHEHAAGIVNFCMPCERGSSTKCNLNELINPILKKSLKQLKKTLKK